MKRFRLGFGDYAAESLLQRSSKFSMADVGVPIIAAAAAAAVAAADDDADAATATATAVAVAAAASPASAAAAAAAAAHTPAADADAAPAPAADAAVPTPALAAAGVDKDSNLYGWHKYEGDLPPVSYFVLYIPVYDCLSFRNELSRRTGRSSRFSILYLAVLFLHQQILLQVGDWHVFSEEGEFPGGVCLLIRPDGMCLRLARGIVLHMDGKRMGSIHSFAYNDLCRNRSGLGRLRILYFELQV
jgi:hypothetical protein